MSDEPRDELAGIARSLRRVLERERAAGSGELLVNAARRSRGSGPAADPAPRESSAAGVATKSVPADREQLFPSASPPAARQVTPVFDSASPPAARPMTPVFDLPPFHGPLNPAGLEARAAIDEAARPVLEAIAAEVRLCEKCALWKTRSKAVPGVGSARSGLVFVGEGPGADEDRLGEPFVGRAGQLLDKIIQAMDDAKLIPGVPLNRQTVFIGNIVHCRPPENRVPLPHEVEQSSPYLLRQIEALKPRVICCLGKTAAEILLGTKSALGALRGKVYRFSGAKLIVTYHPAACLRNPAYKRPVWEDMQMMAREYLAD
jgi:DNA polymerase